MYVPLFNEMVKLPWIHARFEVALTNISEKYDN